MVTEPDPVIVTVLPLIVAGPAVTLKLTAKPESEVAFTANGTSPKVLFPNAVNVID